MSRAEPTQLAPGPGIPVPSSAVPAVEGRAATAIRLRPTAAAALNSAWLYQRRHVIRVAVALLLSRSQDLAGTTEEELHRSLELPPAAENALTTTDAGATAKVNPGVEARCQPELPPVG